MRGNRFYYIPFIIVLILSCESSTETEESSASIIGTWNLTAFNDNSGEVYCPKIIDITSDHYQENEYGGQTCDDLYSFTRAYTYIGNSFVLLNQDIENTAFTIIELTQTELIWETITPNTNQVLKYTYERLE